MFIMSVSGLILVANQMWDLWCLVGIKCDEYYVLGATSDGQ